MARTPSRSTPTSGDFLLTDTGGNQTRFRGFDPGLPPNERGQFESLTDPAGHTLAVTSHTPDGKIAEVRRSDGTTTESYLYTYVSGGPNDGLLQDATLRRQVGGNPWSIVRQTVYTYYDGSQPNGNPHDLRTAQVEDGAGTVLDTTYYRYYTSDGPTGYANGLKYLLNPQSYARLAAVTDPLTATDGQVATYADESFEYDSGHRVTAAVVQGTGCACNGETGQGTFTYAYSTSTYADDFNHWKNRTVETLPDGNRSIVFTNFAGEVMLKVFQDLSDPGNPTLQGRDWITFNKYDNQGRRIETAQPSAVTGYDETAPDLLHEQNGSYQHLADSTGEIDLRDYYASTTATGSTPGGVSGYLADDKVQVGQLGTPILLDSTQYLARSTTVFPEATHTVYRNADGTGAETTTFAYGWFTGTTRARSMTVTAPPIATSQNGPAASDVTTTVYDDYGRPIWTRDGDGYLNYILHDNATGAVLKTINDVETAQTGEFQGLPPAGRRPPGAA